ncbi:NPP1 family protein [Streptomyces wuyuanensis]|uniref:NPP1 family protein n=1 Tax=Streptomyces wuyuanensis TaxID=1196353 RepID=UPI00369FA3A2
MEQSNSYSRPKCNNGWCAIMYALYAEKAKYVSVSAHGDWLTRHGWDMRFDPSGTHPKIVYHKDGPGTHALRFADSADDAVENSTGGWFYPRLIGWEWGYPGGGVPLCPSSSLSGS